MATDNGAAATTGVQGLQITGGAAIVAPPQAFQHGLPANALVVVPLSKPSEELTKKLEEGPVAVTSEKMWELLGFNGPAVQVQDDQGRPIAIGLEDLLDGLEKHWKETPSDLNRARVFAQELLKHQKLQRAEQVLSKLVAKGGNGDDWLALGIAQLQQDKLDKAEGTLKGAANLLKGNPYPALHLARLYGKQDKKDDETTQVQLAISLDGGCVDAWAYRFESVRSADGEEKAIATLEEEAKGKKNAAPFIAIQGFFAANEETMPRAIEFAKKGVEANSEDPVAVLCLSALFGQSGDMDSVIGLLSKHETMVSGNLPLANNYFQALFQTKQIDKVTKLLNSLAGSPNQQIKQFAIQQSQAVSRFLQQQQARLTSPGQA